eukprot:scaffold11663_cov179-Ochromonas_danica.AAC.2
MQQNDSLCSMRCRILITFGGIVSSACFVVDSILSGNWIYFAGAAWCFGSVLASCYYDPYIRNKFINPCLATIGCKQCVTKVHVENDEDEETALISRPIVERNGLSVIVTDVRGSPIKGAKVGAIADNGTIVCNTTDANGKVMLIVVSNWKYQLLVAHREYCGKVVSDNDLVSLLNVKLPKRNQVGSILSDSRCCEIPYSETPGRLEVFCDSYNRNCFYCETRKVTIHGKSDQVDFPTNLPIPLVYSNGVCVNVQVLFLKNDIALMEYEMLNSL